MGSGVPRIQITTPPYLNPAAMRVGDVIQDAYVAGTYPDFAGNPVSEGARTYMVDGAPVAGTYVLQAGDLVGAASLTLTATGAPDRLIFAEPSDVTDFAYDTSDFTFVVPPGAGDVTGPTIVSTVPTDNAVDVAVGASTTITFNEPIQFGTGLITLRSDNGGWADVETFDVATDVGAADGQVIISGATLTINPTGNAANARQYAIRIAATAIEDLAGNPFAGIADDTTLSFTTVAGSAGLVGYDAPILLINNPNNQQIYTATLTGVQVGQEIVFRIAALGDGAGLTPASYVVTLGGVPMAIKVGVPNTGTDISTSIFTLRAAAAGDLAASVDLGAGARGCAVVANKITGYNAAAPYPNSGGKESLTANVTALTEPTAQNTAADGNAILSILGVKGGDITAMTLPGADGFIDNKTGTNGFNDLTFAAGYTLTPTIAAVTHDYAWTVADHATINWIELAKG